MTAESTLEVGEVVKSRGNSVQGELQLAPEASAEQRAAARRAARIQLRLYCLSCGRSETIQRAPVQPGRCLNCGGTLLTELDPA